LSRDHSRNQQTEHNRNRVIRDEDM